MFGDGFQFGSEDWSSGFWPMTAPGTAITNPIPKIAAINLNFIQTSTWIDKAMPELMQSTCQPGDHFLDRNNPRRFNELNAWQRRREGLSSSTQVARFHRSGGFQPSKRTTVSVLFCEMRRALNRCVPRNLQIASYQFIPAPWTPPATRRNIASRLTGGGAMKTIETKHMSRKALTSSAILLGAIFTILLLPAYGQQEIDPTWYDPSPVAAVAHSAQPVAAIQSTQLQTASDDSQATMKSAAQ